MIKITDKAATQIKNLLSKAPEGMQGLRLSVKATGCSGNSYKLEYINSAEMTNNSHDKFGEQGSSSEIYIPKIHSWMLIGTVIDYITDELGNSRFEFTNPNETGRCGCGESFQVAKENPKDMSK